MVIQWSVLRMLICLVVYECRGEPCVRPPEQHLRNLRSVPCHSERKRRISFRYFWLDPKVTRKSRLRALRTTSRRLQVGKSGNSLRFGQPDFLSPCSLLRRLTAGINCQWLIVNCRWLFSKYMIRRVLRITIDR